MAEHETEDRSSVEVDDGPADEPDNRPPEPQGHFVGIPYDWRRPTVARVRARWWNRNDPRLFTPRSFGWGYDLNLYWVTHPGEFVKTKRH